MKQLLLVGISLLFLQVPITYTRYHGRKTIAHAPCSRTFKVTNKAAYPMLLYFKPMVSIKRDDNRTQECQTGNCAYQKKRTRIGYHIAPSSTQTITLSEQELKTMDVYEGIIHNTQLTYGSVTYFNNNTKRWVKKHLTIYNNAHYTLNVVYDSLVITRN